VKNQVSLALAQFSANPNAAKVVSVVLFVSFAVIGLFVPSVVALAGPISGEGG
jgi:hypothetical protein